MKITQQIQISMKRFKTILFASVATVAAVAQTAPVNPNATAEAKQLLEVVYNQRGKGTLSGQHNYPLFSDIYMERVENLTDGHHPVVMGQDFGYSKTNSLDGINYRQRTVDNAIKWYKKGAIVTLMWHSVPPTVRDNYTTWQGKYGVQSKMTAEQWKSLFTEGSELNNNWKTQVDIIAFFLKQLEEAQVPVIWRPYHEMNGDWFWWSSGTPDDYKKLYRMLYERLTNYHGIDNLLWVFNGNELGSPNVKDYELYFPGHDVVDILATDIYRHNYNPRDYDALQKLAKGKPIAWGEVGKMPTPEIIREQPNWVWFMCWSEFLETSNEWAPRKELYDSKEVITLEEFTK